MSNATVALPSFPSTTPPEAGRALVSDVLREIGGPVPVPPKELAALCSLRLVGHSGNDLDEVLEAIGDARSSGYKGDVVYDATAPAQAQERAIATGVARWLVIDRELDLNDADLVDYVAGTLCGLPRSLRSTRP